MKRLIAAFLSLSLASLSAEPAFAASRSLSTPSAAPVVSANVKLSVPGVFAAPTLPAVSIPAAPQVGAPVLTRAERAGIEGVLRQIAAETAPEAKAPEAALDRAYTGSEAQGAPTVSAASPSGGSGGGSGSNLAPSSPNSAPQGSRVPSARSRMTSQRGAANVKVIAAIAGAVLVVALVIGLFIHRGNQKDKLWADSPAAAAVVQVETARRANDAETLFKIAAESRQRAAARAEKIADARTRRLEKVGERSIAQEETLLAFDNLAAARAELNANEVSNDPARRIGKERPATWTSRLNELEADAKTTGFEGRIGTSLDSLAAEVSGENKAVAGLSQDVATFEQTVPSLGGAALKEQREKARADVAGFQGEINAESGEHGSKLNAVRGRIYSRLEAGSAEFRDRSARRSALSTLESGTAATAATRAASVETELRAMADKIKVRDEALKASVTLTDEAKAADAEARRLERAEVKVPVKNPDGTQATDANGSLLWTIEIQDLSGPKKQEAAEKRRLAQAKLDEAHNAAIAARDAAVRAGRDRDELVRQAQLLADDQTLKLEKLASPTQIPGVSVYVVWRWVDLDRQSVEFFYATLTYDQANELRAKFSATKGSFDEAKRAIGAARDAQANWLNGKVTEELERQKKAGW